jgi:hypothetical protein
LIEADHPLGQRASPQAEKVGEPVE